MNLLEILQSWMSNPEYITSDDANSDYVARYEQRKALKKLPLHIRTPLKCIFDFAYYHRCPNIQHQSQLKLKVLMNILEFIQYKELNEDIDKIFNKINEEILSYLKQPQLIENEIENYLAWWIVVFLYDKFPNYKHSEELDKLLWDNLERTLRNKVINPSKEYLIKWLKNISRYDRNDVKHLRLKKIFLKLAFNWIIFQRKSGTDKNNDEVLEVLSAVNNISIDFENPSDNRQFDDLKQKFAQLNFEYSVGGEKKLFYYWFMKRNINSINDLFFDSLIHLRFDSRSGVTNSIWKGRLKSIATKVVIKCFSSSNESDLNKYEHEARLLEGINSQHSFFLNFYADFYDKYINKAEERAYYIVMQSCNKTLGKEIYERMEKGKIYGQFLAYDIYLLLEGFYELKKQNIWHHDIKPDNIFIDEYGNFKIGDFGLSYKHETGESDQTNAVRGTIDYMSPEFREAYGDRSFKSKNKFFSREKSDVFSLGLVFLKMATLKSISGLNAKSSELKLKNEIASLKPRWLSRLLSKMLDMNFETRACFSSAFATLMSDSEFLKEKCYTIDNNKVITFSSPSSRSTKYCIKLIKDSCEKFDIKNVSSLTEPLKFIYELDKSTKYIIFLKDFALQRLLKYLSNSFEKMVDAERRRFKENFEEILNLINMLNSKNRVILHEIKCAIFSFCKGRRPTPALMFTSDSILGNQIVISDFDFASSAEEDIENVDIQDLTKHWDYSGDIYDVDQIEIGRCELCLSDQYPGIKIERYKGRIRVDTTAGIKVPSDNKVSIMIYSFQSYGFGKNKKKFSSSELDLNKWIDKFEKEAHIMKLLSSKGKYFLHYYGAFYQRFQKITKFYIITEGWKYSLKKEIINLREENRKYDDYMIASIVHGLLEAIMIMKENKIVHNGLCTDAIVLPEKGYPFKIIDFSFSLSDITEDSFSETKEHTVHNSKEDYVAPEQLTNRPKAKFRMEKSDVFSLGLIYFQISSLMQIDGFNRNTNNLCEAISKIKIPWLVRLLTQMLNFDYQKRPGLKEVSDILRTDEEYTYDLFASNAIKDLANQQVMMKYLQDFSRKNKEVTSINLSSSQESTNCTSTDLSFIQNLDSSSSNDKWSFINRMNVDHEQYYNREFFLASTEQLNHYEQIIREFEKFSGKRNLFLKYFGMIYRKIPKKINEDNQEISKAKITIRLELCKENLSEYIEKNKTLKGYQIAGIANDLIRGFKYLVRKKIYLFDVNADDFIINQFNELKIYKHIKSFQYWHDEVIKGGSHMSFASPEYLKRLKKSNENQEHNNSLRNFSREKSIVYSVGQIIFYLALGQEIDIWEANLLERALSKVNTKWIKEALALMLNPINMDRPRFSEIISAQAKNAEFKKDLDIYRLSQKISHWPANKKPVCLQSDKNSKWILFDMNERRQFYERKIKNKFEEFEMRKTLR